MPEFEPIKTNSQAFTKGVGLSLAFHLFIISLFVINILFFSKPIIDLTQAISVSFGEIKETEKLPDKVVAPPEEISEIETAQEEAPDNKKDDVSKKESAKKNTPTDKPKAPDVSLKKAKSKQKDALNKLKKLSAMEKINQAIKKDAIAKIKSRTAAEAKPRVVPAGAALVGLDKLQADQYLQLVDQSVKRFWQLPQWLMNKPLQAKILVRFNPNGEVISTQIVSPSGNSSYDQYCLQAITKAAPFPKVPEKFSEKFSLDGVVIGFPE